jgi:hypothetical protein
MDRMLRMPIAIGLFRHRVEFRECFKALFGSSARVSPPATPPQIFMLRG